MLGLEWDNKTVNPSLFHSLFHFLFFCSSKRLFYHPSRPLTLRLHFKHPATSPLNSWPLFLFFLDPGVWYLFKVSTRTKAGWSPETSHWVEMPPGPPSGPPLQVRASPVSSTSIRVTWLEPDVWKKNGPLIGYSVSYNPLNRRGQSLMKNITNPNQTRVVLTRLMKFTDYEIRVRALGQRGPGPLSRPVIEKTNEDGRSFTWLDVNNLTYWRFFGNLIMLVQCLYLELR